MLSPVVAKQFFEAVLEEYGFSGWRVQLDHATNNFRIEANVQTLFLPAYKPLSLARVRELLGHEVEFHVLRAEAGKRTPLALLAEGTRNFLTIDEGIAVYYDQQTAQTQNQALDETSMSTWIGTLATGLAAGVLVAANALAITPAWLAQRSGSRIGRAAQDKPSAPAE